jgi:hypothetical protein
MQQIANAWGNNQSILWRKIQKVNQSVTMDVARKSRSDKGQTVFNSDDKRGSVYTERHCFGMIFRAKYKGEPFDESEIIIQYNGLSEDLPWREEARQLAQQQFAQSAYLEAETGNWLRQTNGSITWERLAQQISGQGMHQIVNKHMVRQHVMSLPGSTYTTTHLHPLIITEVTKTKRYVWAKAFWHFWYSAKLVFPGVWNLLAHMDEKWFYCIIIQKNNKHLKNVF